MFGVFIRGLHAGDLSVADTEQLSEKFRLLDISKSSSERPEDKAEVLTRVTSNGCDLEPTNRELTQALMHTLHFRVKWGDRPEDAANLAVMLMKVMAVQSLCSLYSIQIMDIHTCTQFHFVYSLSLVFHTEEGALPPPDASRLDAGFTEIGL